MPRPVARASQAKSTAHSWLERNHGRPSLARRTNRFLLSRRTISRSSRSLFMTKVLLRRYHRDVRSPILAGGVFRGQVKPEAAQA